MTTVEAPAASRGVNTRPRRRRIRIVSKKRSSIGKLPGEMRLGEAAHLGAARLRGILVEPRHHAD